MRVAVFALLAAAAAAFRPAVAPRSASACRSSRAGAIGAAEAGSAGALEYNQEKLLFSTLGRACVLLSPLVRCLKAIVRNHVL